MIIMMYYSKFKTVYSGIYSPQCFILLWGKTGISKTGPYVYMLFFQKNKFFQKVLGLQEVSAKAAAYSAAKKKGGSVFPLSNSSLRLLL